ncbi:MAG: helix-turn-helix transcriptional regulator [Lachnospiraceae bacterium]|nr:helix-turn-helix transcriptional regulator [Lachnospiraceae bacterium]
MEEKGFNDKIENSILDIIDRSLEFHYVYGISMREWQPHNETTWRVLPYTTIVAKGNCMAEYTVEVRNKGVFYLKNNSVFVIPAGEEFKIELKEPALLGNAHINYTVLGQIDLLSFFQFPGPIEGRAAIRMIELMDELAECDRACGMENGDLYHLIHRKQLAFGLLEQLVQMSGQRMDINDKISDIKRIHDVIRFINEHMAEKISRKNLADIVHLSETRFHYVFKGIMGASPMDYLMMQRLQEAQKRLLVTNDAVGEIAKGVGIDDVSYFGKLFKRKFYVSPLRYRQMGLGRGENCSGK